LTTEPGIKYATTLDGARIAFWEIGEGAPLVIMPGEPLWQIQLIRQVPPWQTWLERLAQKRRVIIFDGRATGLSDGTAEDLNLQSQRVDLVAVVDHLDLKRFDLFAPLSAGPAAVTYAVAHPRRLQNLILWCSYANGAEYMESGSIKGMLALMKTDWELFLEIVAHARFDPEGEGESTSPPDLLGEFLDEGSTEAFYSGISHVEVTAMLSKVQAPTLVMSRGQAHIGPGIDASRSLASGIPNARLILLDGISVAPYLGDAKAVLGEIIDFLSEGDLPLLPPDVRSLLALPGSSPEPLTPREIDVLNLVAQGMSNQEVADALVIGVGTVKSHLYKVFGKLDVKRRTQASAKAKELGLI